MAKTKSQKNNEERIRKLMEDACIYEPRYELQIEQTAETMVDIDEMKAVIKKEGRVVQEVKTGGLGMKSAAHPLYMPLNQSQQLLLRQMASLGLNKLSEKKSEAKEAKRQEMDGVEAFFAGRKR